MGLRFRKSFKIAPGVRVNLGKKSAGISLGTKGARVSFNTKGRRTTTVGIPGTGISYSTSSGGKKKKQTKKKIVSTNNAVRTTPSASKQNLKEKTEKKTAYTTYYKLKPNYANILLGLITGILGILAFIQFNLFWIIVSLVLFAISFLCFHEYYHYKKYKNDEDYTSDEEFLQWQKLVLPNSENLTLSITDLINSSIPILERCFQIVTDSVAIVSKTTNVQTFFERYGLIEANLKTLIDFSRFITLDEYANPEELLTNYTVHKAEYIKRLIDLEWNKTTAKVESLKTEKGKENQYIKFIASFDEYKAEMSEDCISYYKDKMLLK